MKIDTTQILHDFNGVPMTRKDGEDMTGRPPPMVRALTLRMIIQDVCGGYIKGDEGLTGSRMFANGEIARKAAQDEADYSREEIDIIRDRVARGMPQGAIVNPVWRILDAAIAAEAAETAQAA